MDNLARWLAALATSLALTIALFALISWLLNATIPPMVAVGMVLIIVLFHTPMVWYCFWRRLP